MHYVLGQNQKGNSFIGIPKPNRMIKEYIVRTTNMVLQIYGTSQSTSSQFVMQKHAPNLLNHLMLDPSQFSLFPPAETPHDSKALTCSECWDLIITARALRDRTRARLVGEPYRPCTEHRPRPCAGQPGKSSGERSGCTMVRRKKILRRTGVFQAPTRAPCLGWLMD